MVSTYAIRCNQHKLLISCSTFKMQCAQLKLGQPHSECSVVLYQSLMAIFWTVRYWTIPPDDFGDEPGLISLDRGNMLNFQSLKTNFGLVIERQRALVNTERLCLLPHTHILSKFPIDYFPSMKESGNRNILSWMWFPS